VVNLASTWEKMGKKGKQTKETKQPPKEIQFQKLSPELTIQKLKIGIHGEEKTGKTRWAMSSSVNYGPTYIIATEPGIRPLARLFPKKDLYFCDVYEPDYTGIFEVEASQTLANIDQAVRQIRELALKDPKSVGTVVVDSVSDVWKWVQEWMKMEVLKIDKTARVKQQWDWGHANNKYQNIIMQLISLPCHVILTAQDREQWAGPGQPTGVYEPRWQKQTGYWVDIIIGLKKIKDKMGQVHYMAEIEDSRHMDKDLNPIAGKTFENFDFDELVGALTIKEKKK